MPTALGCPICVAVALLVPAADPADRTHLLRYRDDKGEAHPVATAADWTRRRTAILDAMQEVMGPLPDAKTKVPLDVQVLEEKRTDEYVCKQLLFTAEKDDRVPAYLLIPRGRTGKLPAVLCLHPTNGKLGKAELLGLGGSPNMRYAFELTRRGYVTLTPDYPSFGEYAYDFARSPHPSGSIKAIWNNVRALDLLGSLPEVDPERIGCMGHSLGGHNALFTAAFDTRIKAVVSNCGFTSFPKYYGGKLKGWTSARYMPRIEKVYELKPERVPFDFPEVLAAIAPRACLAIAPLHDDNFEVSGVKDCIAAAKPVYELLGAGERLAVRYPDCKHDFPAAERQAAYEWFDRWLK